MMIILGIVFCAIGFVNRKGNINSLHSYHRNKVLPEDVLPYGKRIGAGMITIGGGMIVYAIFTALKMLSGVEWLFYIGTAVMVGTIAVGTVMIFAAMIKYNKGIF